MNIPGQYVPLDRRWALTSHKPLPDRTRGAVLFADIAGFSPLTKALTQELGPQRGVEELSHIINQVYEDLITTVHQYGGAVITFGGDAITCWFDGDEGVQAVTCALKMQEAMRPHTTIHTPTGLMLHINLKVSVAVGPARRFLVGDPEWQQIEVLAGATLERVGTAELVAQQGEVLLDEAGAAALGERLHITAWRQMNGYRFALITAIHDPAPAQPDIALPDIPDEIARPWLPPPVYARLKRGEGEYLTEIRMAVAMFVAFRGIDYDADETAGAKLDTFIRWVQAVLARYEGYLIDLSMGDKGSHFYAVFGALKAHENDPVRAVAAALELQNLPVNCEFIHHIRIGLSRGRMRCGMTGAQARRTYGVHGNEANVAAHLMMQAQPQQILATERIVTAPGQQVNFRLLGEIHLKGDTSPLKVFTPQVKIASAAAPRPSTQNGSSFIGRERERTLVRTLFHRLTQDKDARHMVFVEGEAGIGKSRLLRELLQDAHEIRLRPLVGEANAIEKTTPYYAWRLVFAQLLRQIAPEGVTPETPERWREFVVEQLHAAAPVVSHLAPLLNPILALDLPETETTRELVGEIRANNTRWILVALLQKAAQNGPLLLILDDGHWMDSASWALLLAVHQVIQPLLTIMMLRPLPDNPPPEYVTLSQQASSYQLSLNSLSRDQIETMICQRLGIQNLPEAVLNLIHNKAEGHPFFSEELAYALRDTGVIRIKDAVCEIAPHANEQLHHLNFPDTIEGVITSRIDLLPLQQQLALKVGSVIGRVFAFSTLYDIHPVEADKAQLKTSLHHLERFNVLASEQWSWDTGYLFKHILLQEVAYNLLPHAQKRQLHEQIALWYEQHYHNEISHYYPLLAYHWLRAENDTKALENLEKAAEQAFRNFANEEAITFLKQALELDERTMSLMSAERRARWELMLGEAYVHRSQYDEGLKHLEAGVALLGHPVAVRGRVMPHVLKEFLTQVVHRYFPSFFLGRQQEQRENLLTVTRAYNRLVEVYYFNGASALAFFACLKAANIGELSGRSPNLAEAYGVMSAAASQVFLFGLSERYARRALEMVEQANNIQAQNSTFMVIGAQYHNVGKLVESEHILKRLVEQSVQSGDFRRQLDGLHWLSRVYFQQGYYEKALPLTTQLLDAAATRQEPRFVALARFIQAACYLRMGQTDTAFDGLVEIERLFSEKKLVEAPLEREIKGLFITIALRRQAYDEALDHAAALVEMSAGLSYTTFANLAIAEAIVLYLTLWEQRGQILSKQIKQGMFSLRFFAGTYPLGQPSHYYVKGWLAQLQGKEKKARRYWQKALMWAEQNGMLYERGRVHAIIALYSPPTSLEYAAHLQQARDLFNQINAQYDLHVLGIDNGCISNELNN